MRRDSGKRKEKKEKCIDNSTNKKKNFTHSDGYIRYPDYSDASSTTCVAKRVTTLKLQEKALLTEEEGEEELLDYSPKEGEGRIDSARMTYRIWGDGKFCENKKPYENVQFCFLCELDTTDLKHGTRMTGEKLDGEGRMYPIYRHLFMCQTCFSQSPREKKVRVSSRALQTYY